MKLNNEYNFGVVPTVNTPRSRFLMHKNIRTTFNAAELIPIYANPLIQPGDTLKVKSTMVIRMTTPKFPTMDNLFADLRAFFIPHRLVWDHFKQFIGENDTGAWTLTTNYTIPQLRLKTTANDPSGVQLGDALQYMGIRLGYPAAAATATGYEVSALPMRAYISTWNNWYRDENFCPPYPLNTGDTATYSIRNATYAWGTHQNSNYFYPKCAPVYKFKDIFNSCLPEPQKLTGGPVTLPIGQSAPVWGNGKSLGLTDGTDKLGIVASAISPYSLFGVTGAYNQNTGTYANTTVVGGSKAFGVVQQGTNEESGLYADLSNAVAATINAQRIAFAIQRIGELSARAGTRYPEVIEAFFSVKGVQSAVIGRPQYLGGFRLPLQMSQVLQTSSTDTVSPQGNTAAYSLTVDSQHLFTHSFEEWGTLLFCLCVRQEHSYSQGIESFWKKKEKYDFYWPQLAFLGESPIMTSEIFADGSANDDTVFGYNERWVEYRTERNINTGLMSPDASGSLSVWHYGDDYSNAPVLSDTWRRETPDYIDRTLTVAHTVSHQFLMDSRFEFDACKAIPLRSIPGLLDHF